jgi:glycosyltransferase involved in cell wall biosynthesis
MLRAARSKGVTGLMFVAIIVPARVRRIAFAPFAAQLERAAARRPGSRYAPQLAFVARWSVGPLDAARDLARRAGTSTASAPVARRQLAIMARVAGLRDVAAEIVASLPDDRSGEIEVLRGRIAIDEGRYTDALLQAELGLDQGVRGGREVAEIARGQLTAMQAGWTPDLGTIGSRLSANRGAATRGRIVHLVSVSLPYRQAGYTVRTEAVARCQRAAGLDPHVATRAGFPRNIGVRRAPAQLSLEGIPHHLIEADIDQDQRLDRALTNSARATVALLERLRPAALHPASNYQQAQIALALARPLGIPVVYEVRGFWEETWLSAPSRDETVAMDSERYRLTREAETSAMVAADAIVTLAETMREAIIARGCAPEKVVVVPNAVDTDRFRPVARDEALAASLGIGRHDPVIGYISTFSPYEGIAYLLEAGARLRTRNPGLRVLLVGDGMEEEAIVRTGKRLGLDDGTLIMPGRVPHDRIVDYYSLIDVFVVPRTADRVSGLVTPLKPYEAMAMGQALVVSDLPALREIVLPGQTGLTFKAEDAEDLATVIGGLLDDPTARTRLGGQAREWILANRTWPENGRRYRELFERLGAA